MDAVVSGELSPEDLRIAPETLQLQAQLADASGRPQLAANFRRAAEMTAIPDDEVLAMYNALRPRASTGAALEEMADRLERTYSAPVCAAQRLSGAYETRAIRSPGTLRRRQHRRGAPPSSSVTGTISRPESSVERSSFRADGGTGRAV